MSPNPLGEVYISEADLKAFQEDGAVCLRNVFDQKWVELVRSGIEKNLQNPSRYSESLTEGSESSAYFDDYCNWDKIPEFQEYVYKSPAAEIAGRLTRSEYMVFYHEHVLVKEAGTSKKTPWHHDQSYYPIDGFKVCSIWMPVDPVSKECSIQFVAGSHRWNKWFYPRKFATNQNYAVEKDEQEREYHDIPDIDAGIQRNEYKVLQWGVEPGDCIVFHMRTVHGAPGNSSPVPRRVLSTRWLGDDAVAASRPWEVSPPIGAGILSPGSKVSSSDVFPIVWKKIHQ